MKKWMLFAAVLLVLSACGAQEPQREPESAPVLRLESDAQQARPEPEAGPESAPEKDSASTPETAPESASESAPELVETLLAGMSTEQKVGQLFFARCPETGAAEQIAAYQPAGLILFGRDFQDQTPESVRETLAAYQAAAELPLLIGVDEEGGTVVRVSGKEHLRPEKFRSPQALFQAGGWEEIVRDTAEKDALLRSLTIHVNFAPVADVSTNPSDFMYPRAFGQGAEETAQYVAAVVRQMRADRMGSVLKHFPGYGSNADTHTGGAVDRRTLREFRSRDFIPFAAGIQAGADAVLVSHTIVESMDAARPASLSPTVHKFLRGELRFSGVILTDDLAMEAAGQYGGAGATAVLAVQAGNDLLLSSDLPAQYAAVLEAVRSGEIDGQQLDEAVGRVLRWKERLGLLEAAAE